MKSIDRYIYTVTRHLPKNLKEDVSKELRTNIEEMLPPNPTEQQIEQVLKEIGNPWDLAHEYQPEHRYLIGPKLYDTYLMVLKLVGLISVVVLLVVTLLSWAFNPNLQAGALQSVIDLFTRLFSNVWVTLIQALFWVTIIFVVLERSNALDNESTYHKKEWELSDLPEVHHPKLQISRVETTVELTFSIFFAIILVISPAMIGYFELNNGSLTQIPIFNLDHLESFAPFIIASLLFSSILMIWNLIQNQWTPTKAILNVLTHVLSTAVTFTFLLNPSLFNLQFLEKMASLTSLSIVNVQISSQYLVYGIVIIIIIATLVDIIKPFYYLYLEEKSR